MNVYTEGQLQTIQRLARAYGHWYAPYIDPHLDAGLDHGALIVRVEARQDSEDFDSLPMPCTVAGPPEPDGYHETGTGRLRWSVNEDGVVMVGVYRPNPDVVAWRKAWAEGDGTPEPRAEPVRVISATIDGVTVEILDIEGAYVRHVDALAEVCRALGTTVPAETYVSCPDTADIANQVRRNAADIATTLTEMSPAEIMVSPYRHWLAR